MLNGEDEGVGLGLGLGLGSLDSTKLRQLPGAKLVRWLLVLLLFKLLLVVLSLLSWLPLVS